MINPLKNLFRSESQNDKAPAPAVSLSHKASPPTASGGASVPASRKVGQASRLSSDSDDSGLGTVDYGLNNDAEKALVSKIARLPHDIREDLNRHLYDGKTAPEILPWLNELPAVKEVLRVHFGGAPVTPQNLSSWRANGYQRWLKKQEPLADIQQLSEDASDFFKAGCARIATGAATFASSRIFEYLRNLSPDKRTPEEFEKIISLLNVLLKAEQGEARLKLAEKRVLQRDEHLLLIRDRDQRDDVAVAMRALGDAQAREIYASGHSHAQKIELLGHHMFKKLWLGRYVPEENQGAPQSNQIQPNPA